MMFHILLLLVLQLAFLIHAAPVRRPLPLPNSTLADDMDRLLKRTIRSTPISYSPEADRLPVMERIQPPFLIFL